MKLAIKTLALSFPKSQERPKSGILNTDFGPKGRIGCLCHLESQALSK